MMTEEQSIELLELWNSFLKAWPIETVKNMTLQQYTQVGDHNTFCYWLEQKTKPIANIMGGSAFKFGVFHRNDRTEKENTKGRVFEQNYAYAFKYGDSVEQAFLTIKNIILQIIEATQQGDLERIDQIDFSPVLKWKIAFLYQDQANPQILAIFAKSWLEFISREKGKSQVELYQILMSQKGDQNLFIYNNSLVQKYLDAHPKAEKFTVEVASQYLAESCSNVDRKNGKLWIFKNTIGREIGLVMTNKSVNLFIEKDPVDNEYFDFKPNETEVADGYYEPNKSRHSGLNKTDRLGSGHPAYYIEIPTQDDLENFCNWYELNTPSSINKPCVDQNMKNNDANKKIPQALNRILFGAAGTGKTYHSINHAVSIIDGQPELITPDIKLDANKRLALKNRFDELVDEGRIRFVTFHQSFSYEDFVEGIRAETDKETKQLTYPVQDGVFKAICKRAGEGSLQGKSFGKHIVTQDRPDYYEVEKPNGNLLIISKKLSHFLIDNLKNNKISLIDIKNGEVIEKLGNHPILEPYIVNGYNGLLVQLIPFIMEHAQYQQAKKEPYVLIIDEINRGNISRIFGELITLIEDSKRSGADEALSVTLPYSKEEFSVPNNVYIIGTMNSSDRSLTGLDMALRRRFSFVEMPPNPELLSNINISKDNININMADLLIVMNQRIEVLLDRDHCIGHANFMSLNNESTVDDLAHIFKQKIIPLLQEYFFDDWSKINLVLNGNGMLKPKTIEKSVLFPNAVTAETSYFEDQKTWELIDSAFELIESFTKIIKH